EDDDGKLMALAADHAQHAEPVESGQAEIEDDEVVSAGAHQVDRLVAVLDDVGGEALGAQPLGHEGRDAVLVLDDEYAGQLVSLSSRCQGRRSRNVAPSPWTELTVTDPPWALAMRSTIVNPSPVPWRPCLVLFARATRSKIRFWSSAALPAPASRTHSSIIPSEVSPAMRPPKAIVPDSSVESTLWAASCSSACVSRCSSTMPNASGVETMIHRRGARALAFEKLSRTRSVRSASAGTRKSGRSLRASMISSSTRRDMRLSSSPSS